MAENGRRSPLFSSSPTGILVLQRNGNILDVNASGCQAFCRQKGRLTEKPFLDWVLPGDRPRAAECLERTLDGEAVRWKSRIRRGDGLARIQEFEAIPLSRNGEVEGVLLFMTSLGEGDGGRPEARQLLSLLENLPGQFVVVTDKGGRIRHSSGLSRTHFRDDRGLLGKPFADLLGKERGGEETVGDLFKAVCEGQSWGGLQWHRRQDGASIPVEIFAAPHQDPRNGQVVGVLIAGRDISPVQKWKEKAQRARPLAQIGVLTTRISTEMEESLNRLEGFLKEKGGGAGLSASSREVAEELGRLRRFLGGISEFGSRGRVRRQSVSLTDLTHEALEREAGRLGSLRIQPTVECPPNLPRIHADPRYLERVLSLVLTNALEALQEVSTPVLQLELKNGPDGVILRVTNSGSRVGAEWLGEILDPFFTTKEGHPGLGLTVARGMMEALDGRLWAEVPQEGFLTIALELPREDPNQIRPFRAAPLNLARSRSILVVDDDEDIRGSLRAFLEKVGYEVKEAWSGRSALAVLTSGRLPDLLLTDLKMSDGSGFWFLEELGRDFPRLVRRTVIITGDTDHESATELAEQTGCPLVRKPFELPDLLEILDRVSLRG